MEQFPKPAGTSLSKSQAKAPIPASYIGGTVQNHYIPDYNYHVVDDMNYKAVRTKTATDVRDSFFFGLCFSFSHQVFRQRSLFAVEERICRLQ